MLKLLTAIVALSLFVVGCEPQPEEQPTGDAAAQCYARGGDWQPRAPKPGEIQKPGTEGTGYCRMPTPSH